jgi:energy-coupling factor transporter ATP-binding protein EcfA2
MSLRLTGASYRYAGASQPALESVDLELTPGTIVGVVGANESGKSTLALVASGLAPRLIGGELTGTVLIDELDTRIAPSYALAQRCGVLFQNPLTQLSGTAPTVWEEIAFAPRNLGLPLPEIVDRVDWAIGTLRLDPLIERDPMRLSGGQAQLVALAGVLAMRPAYLVLDEPTSELDPQGTRQVATALALLAAETRCGVLIVEHKTDLLRSLTSSIAVMAAGRIERFDSTEAVFGNETLLEFGVRPPEAVALARASSLAGKWLDERLLSELADSTASAPR